MQPQIERLFFATGAIYNRFERIWLDCSRHSFALARLSSRQTRPVRRHGRAAICAALIIAPCLTGCVGLTDARTEATFYKDNDCRQMQNRLIKDGTLTPAQAAEITKSTEKEKCGAGISQR